MSAVWWPALRLDTSRVYRGRDRRSSDCGRCWRWWRCCSWWSRSAWSGLHSPRRRVRDETVRMKTVQSIEQNEIRFYDSLYADIWQQYPDLVVTEAEIEELARPVLAG